MGNSMLGRFYVPGGVFGAHGSFEIGLELGQKWWWCRWFGRGVSETTEDIPVDTAGAGVFLGGEEEGRGTSGCHYRRLLPICI